MNALNNPIRLMQLAIITTMGAIILATPFVFYMVQHHLWTLSCGASACILAGLIIVSGLSQDLLLELRKQHQRMSDPL